MKWLIGAVGLSRKSPNTSRCLCTLSAQLDPAQTVKSTVKDLNPVDLGVYTWRKNEERDRLDLVPDGDFVVAGSL